MRVISVVGARPQFVKLAPIHEAISEVADHQILHTGQHYDENMSGSFFRELNLPGPAMNLAVGSGSHGFQTATMIAGIETHLVEQRPDWVIVYGDTNSTLAASIACSKIAIPIAHLEAGLRSGNRAMPEEVNRIVTDHVSDICLAPTTTALTNLEREGLSNRSVLVGDVMVDVLRQFESSVQNSPPDLPWNAQSEYIFATLHRAGLTDSPLQLKEVVNALKSLSIPVYLAAHPRLLAALDKFDISVDGSGALTLVDPLPYSSLIFAVRNAAGVITDSGGLQKEAYLLKTPCATIRPETEWVETVHSGWNQLFWENLLPLTSLDWTVSPLAHDPDLFGDGHAAQRVVEAISSWPELESARPSGS